MSTERQRSTLVDRPDRESERLLALYRASTALTAQTAEPDAVLDQVLRSAVRLLDAGSASLYLWDADAEILRCARDWQVPPDPTWSGSSRGLLFTHRMAHRDRRRPAVCCSLAASSAGDSPPSAADTGDP